MWMGAHRFFDLADFKHRRIFSSDSPVYAALGATIESYLRETVDGTTNKIRGTVSDKAFLSGTGIVIEEGARVEPGVYIQGPVWIGPGCEIRHGAYLRGNIITGSDCVIGHATEIKNSIMLDRARAAHFAYIGDSVIGNDVNLGAGTRLANLRLDRCSVSLRIRGEIVDTGLQKFGAILGDRVQTGCNSVTNPGTVLSKDSMINPCMSVSGVHLEKRIFGRENVRRRDAAHLDINLEI